MFKRAAVGLGLALSLLVGLNAGPVLAAPTGSSTQQISQKVGVCDPLFAGHCIAPTAGGAVPISGTITTSLGAFIAKGNATLAVTTTSARVAFPTGDTSVIIRNTGTSDAYLAFGISTVTATTGSTLLPAGQAVNFDTGGATYLAAITASGSTNLAITTGTGLSALTGGGGGGGSVPTGSAGSPNAAVVTIQGITGGTTVPVTLTGSNSVSISGTPSVAAAANAFADGWDVTEGTKADAAWSGSGSGSVVAILKAISGTLGTATPTCSGSPSCTGSIGGVNAYQSGSGNTIPPAADSSVAINVSTATTTQLVALSSGKKIYVSSFDVIAGGTGNITFEYGTGTACATGTTVLTGAYNLTAQNGIAKGNGLGAVLVVPAGNALCVLTSAAVQMSGSVSYAQY